MHLDAAARRRLGRPAPPVDPLSLFGYQLPDAMRDECISERLQSYSQTAKAYDITRVPVGLTILIERFGASGLALARQHVLDVGSGAGNYLHALKDIVGSLVGLDGSQEMLLRAAQKCAGCSKAIGGVNERR